MQVGVCAVVCVCAPPNRSSRLRHPPVPLANHNLYVSLSYFHLGPIEEEEPALLVKEGVRLNPLPCRERLRPLYPSRLSVDMSLAARLGGWLDCRLPARLLDRLLLAVPIVMRVSLDR